MGMASEKRSELAELLEKSFSRLNLAADWGLGAMLAIYF